MATTNFYTRVFSTAGPRQLMSSLALLTPKRDRYRLSGPELPAEFAEHSLRHHENAAPSALVTVCTCIIETIYRAIEMFTSEDQAAEDIDVVFIRAPDSAGQQDAPRIHSSLVLARRCGHPNPRLYKYEHVFEWEVPEECVVHRVSLQTLLDGGLGRFIPGIDQSDAAEGGGGAGRVPLPRSTEDLRRTLALQLGIGDPWNQRATGLVLGQFARVFGPPTRELGVWIARRLFTDCAQPWPVPGGSTRIRRCVRRSPVLGGPSATRDEYMHVNSGFYRELDAGINEALSVAPTEGGNHPPASMARVGEMLETLGDCMALLSVSGEAASAVPRLGSIQ